MTAVDSSPHANTNPQVPAMPRLKTRARAATRRYWKALHTSGAWGRLDPLARVQVEMLLQLVDDMQRASSPHARRRYRDEIRLHERELGLRGEHAKRAPRARPHRPRAPALAVLEE